MRINISLPDVLAEEVRRHGIPVSAVCQRALCDELEPPPDGPQVLVCAVCYFVASDVAPPAVTVINGLAVCGDHAERAIDTAELWRIIAAIRKEQRES